MNSGNKTSPTKSPVSHCSRHLIADKIPTEDDEHYHIIAPTFYLEQPRLHDQKYDIMIYQQKPIFHNEIIQQKKRPGIAKIDADFSCSQIKPIIYPQNNIFVTLRQRNEKSLQPIISRKPDYFKSPDKNLDFLKKLDQLKSQVMIDYSRPSRKLPKIENQVYMKKTDQKPLQLVQKSLQLPPREKRKMLNLDLSVQLQNNFKESFNQFKEDIQNQKTIDILSIDDKSPTSSRVETERFCSALKINRKADDAVVFQNEKLNLKSSRNFTLNKGHTLQKGNSSPESENTQKTVRNEIGFSNKLITLVDSPIVQVNVAPELRFPIAKKVQFEDKHKVKLYVKRSVALSTMTPPAEGQDCQMRTKSLLYNNLEYSHQTPKYHRYIDLRKQKQILLKGVSLQNKKCGTDVQASREIFDPFEEQVLEKMLHNYRKSPLEHEPKRSFGRKLVAKTFSQEHVESYLTHLIKKQIK